MSVAISVTRAGDGEPLAFDVSLREGKSETRHRVSLSQADLSRLACGATAETLIEASFRFLLDREPKEAILSSFELRVIARYFPEFETELASYLNR